MENLVSDVFNDYFEDDEDEYQTPYDRFIDEEEEYFALVGKYVLRNGSKKLIVRFRQNVDQFSHTGNIPIISAYRFKKVDAINMKSNGSNFKDYAEKIL